MPKLPSFTPKKLRRRLEKIGFIVDHTTGSHIVMFHPVSKRRAVIPYHLRDIPKGTLSSLMREAGILREELLGK